LILKFINEILSISVIIKIYIYYNFDQRKLFRVNFNVSKEKTKIIIGNGFDLQCKLNSSYKYFFCHSNSIREVDSWIKNLNMSDIDTYLFKPETGNWKEFYPNNLPENTSQKTHLFGMLSLM